MGLEFGFGFRFGFGFGLGLEFGFGFGFGFGLCTYQGITAKPKRSAGRKLPTIDLISTKPLLNYRVIVMAYPYFTYIMVGNGTYI